MKKLYLISYQFKFNYIKFFKSGLIVLLFGVCYNSAFCQNRNYSREFNFDPYHLGGDSLIYFNPADGILFKATFEKLRIGNLLGDILAMSPEERNNWYVEVTVVEIPLTRNPTYRFTLFNPQDVDVESKNANYPCPNSCQPPNMFLKSFVDEPTFRFDANDLIVIYEDPDTKLINIQISLNGDFRTILTFAIYGLSGDYGNADDLLEPNVDPVFISIPHTDN